MFRKIVTKKRFVVLGAIAVLAVAGSSSLQVGTVHAVVSTNKVGCEAADFTIANTVENQTIPAKGSGVSLAHNGSITMADTEANQDACKGATITLTLSS